MENTNLEFTQQSITKSICTWIERLGCRHIFLVPGSQIEPFCKEVIEYKKLKLIVACHELGAAYMADGYARASNTPGVCLSIGGPGASYMLPSAMVSRVDESAVLYITGDVPTNLKNHLCFQDTGIEGSRDRQAYKSLIDCSEIINNPDDLLPVLNLIGNRLRSQLPAHLVIPFDIQGSKTVSNTTFDTGFKNNPIDAISNKTAKATKALLNLLKVSKHPIIIAGHRIKNEKGYEKLKQFAEATQIRVATTYRAKGIFPEDHSLSLGNFGYAGTEKAHEAILGHECDLIILLGFSISQRNTFSYDERFMPKGRSVIFIDTKASSFNFELENYDEYVVDSVADVLEAATDTFNTTSFENTTPDTLYNNSEIQTTTQTPMHPGYIRLDKALLKIRQLTPSNTILFVDSGAHRIVAGTKWKAFEPFTFFTSDLEAPMGWAICAAIGAKLARPNDPVLVLTGDGCMRMHAMEIATAARYSIPVIFIISNNASYHTIQKRMQTNNEKGILGKLPLVDWVGIATSLGVEGQIVTNLLAVEQTILYALSLNKPYVIDLRTHPEETFNSANTIPDGLWPDQPFITQNSYND